MPRKLCLMTGLDWPVAIGGYLLEPKWLVWLTILIWRNFSLICPAVVPANPTSPLGDSWFRIRFIKIKAQVAH